MEKNRIHTQPYGNRIRMSFAREKSVLEMPNLLDVQKDSYNWFIDEGLREVFEDINPIVDFSGNLSLEFVDFNLKSTPKYSIQEAKERDATYSAPLKVKVRLTNGETGEVQEHEVFMGDFPLMTETGTFVINGAERVIVSQLVRSPGIYYARTIDKTGKNLYSSTVIPNRGAWLEYETDSNDIFYVRVDRNRKLPVTVLIRALGVGTDAEIREMFGEDPKLLATLERDTTRTVEEGLMEIYRRLRPGEPPTVESSKSLLYGMFYDSRRYNLARVGRYKFNKKLMLHNRIVGCVLMEDVVNQATGELLASAGEVLTEQLCDDIQNAGIPFVIVNREEMPVKILSNLMVDIKTHLDLTDEQLKACNIGELVYFPVLEEILEADLSGDELLET
ncbi:MAG: DNA-directed RNA polymerase subunit beta, partial [Firmicutes bacterium]|nr:DNA-directed RNA polymerase subunit beta [Bacillota bacterium]